MSKINNDWKEILEEEFQKDYFVELKSCTFRTRSLSSERSGTWFSFFSKLWNKDTTITFKYV